MSFKIKDHFYRKAKKESFLARSVYKLEEIQSKYKILRRGDRVLDLGYYPGSWTQYVSRCVGQEGVVVGVDQKPMSQKLSNLHNVRLHQGDIYQIDSLESLGEGKGFEVVLSDMAPNTTGMKSVDQARSFQLVERVFELVPIFLRPGGHVVVKVFASEDAQMMLREISSAFHSFQTLRPRSTRSSSWEYFVIAKGFKVGYIDK